MRIWLALMLWLAAGWAVAQEFTGLARLDVTQSRVVEAGEGVEITLYLSQPVPWRVFTLDAPRRLVLDFREVDWRGARPDDLIQGRPASDVRFGALRPGWSRMVVDLVAPMAVTTAEMAVGAADGTATLRVRLDPVDAATYAAGAGVPPGAGWDDAALTGATVDGALMPPPPDDGETIVVIDPGHGGVDPGAMREGVVEAELMLVFARELAEAVNRTGTMRAVLTREADIFVPLAERMTIARAAGADVLLSLHADALEEFDAARGASVYTLSQEAVDAASARMAERHGRGDLLAGLDLSGQDDTVATVLMDLARLETAPAAIRLADTLVVTMAQAGAVMNSRPRREGPLAVLNAADFPSVLIEAGFLSSEDDRARLTTAEGRAPIIRGIVDGLQLWAADEEVRRGLLRQ